MTDAPTPKAGDECPTCHYSPLYEDAGFLICIGCDTRFPIVGAAREWEEPLEEG